MNDLLNYSKRFLKRNGSTILTGLSVAGLAATTVLAIKATPKATKLIAEAKEEKGEDLTTLETIKIAGPVYIPTIITGVTTVACIIGSNVLNKRQQASLMSAYALLDTRFKEYKSKLKELYGEETHQNIIHSIAVEKAQDVCVTGGYLGTSVDLSVEDNDGEPKLFYDGFGERYFEATIEQVLTAEYHLNRNYVLRGYADLNEFYEFLGLECTDYGAYLGWFPVDEGMYWIEFNHHKTTLDDGMECYYIEMPFEPFFDFENF